MSVCSRDRRPIDGKSGTIADTDFPGTTARAYVDPRAIRVDTKSLCIVDIQRCVLRQEPAFDGIAVVDSGSSPYQRTRGYKGRWQHKRDTQRCHPGRGGNKGPERYLHTDNLPREKDRLH